MNPMFANIRTYLQLAIVAMTIPLLANAEQQLGWNDLGVTVHPSEDPFFALTFEQKRNLEIVLKANNSRVIGETIPTELASLETGARLMLEKSDQDVERLIAQESEFRKKISNQGRMIRDELDGSKIRIPGYVVPIGFDGILVSEFLLVPYAGACIHTPPPPPSQIIHVHLKRGFELSDPYTPVWVSGELNANLTRHSANLSDGTSSFDVGYQISVGVVESYK